MNIAIEPEHEGDRQTPYHKRIVKADPIPGTRAGNVCTLECGHQVQTFGDLAHARGVALCQECRSDADLRRRFEAEVLALAARIPQVELVIRSPDAWYLLSALQLALRCPDIEERAPDMTREVKRIARRLQELVAPPGSAMEEVAERGWRGE